LPPPTKNNLPSLFSPVQKAAGHRVVLYGPGGIGKTTLATKAPGKVAFIDTDESLGRLSGVDHVLVANVASWADLRTALKSDAWTDIKTLVIDSVTKLEEWAIEYTLQTVKHEKGTTCRSIEDYGYGKGYQHVFETFMTILADLDRLCRQGKTVILIAHDCVNNVPNPEGEDWIRYEPRLQNPASGRSSIRLRLKEWADHVLFLGYDVTVSKEGKAQGAGSRTIYTAELPHCMAKSRTTQEQIPLREGTDVWRVILN
jgi:hypothetical protein